MDSFYGGLPGQGFELIHISSKTENIDSLPVGGYALLIEEGPLYTEDNGMLYKKKSTEGELEAIAKLIGPAAGFGEITYDNTNANKYGTASVTVTSDKDSPDTVKVFNFAFQNLKGNGITSIESSADNDNGVTLTIKTDEKPEDGDSFTIFEGFKIGTVKTGNPGTDAAATIDGVTSPTLNFTIPKGATGAKGDPGPIPSITINADETVDTTTNKWGLKFTEDTTSSAEQRVFNAQFQVPASIKAVAEGSIICRHEVWSNGL